MAGDDRLREVAALLLAAVGPAGFALAGAGAVREHGLTWRDTADVDLFAMSTMPQEEFEEAVRRSERALRERGYAVTRVRTSQTYARLVAADNSGGAVEVDLGVNWRSEPPVVLALGPVLAERDAVGGKLSAVYSRREVRDFLDLDAIRRSGRYTDEDLLEIGREQDDGFDAAVFAGQLSLIVTIDPSRATRYGVDAADFARIQDRLYAWAVELRQRHARPDGA